MNKYLIILLTATAMLAGSCEKTNPDDNSFNLFSVEDDIKLGQQVSAEIAANPQDYPVLDSAQYPQAYAYVYDMRNKILNSGYVYYKDRFPWTVKIIQNDAELNAFATPGGYIYVYTGLIKYLNAEHQLAGVLGHEMAHSDRRHTTDQLTKIYGLSIIADYLLGNNQGLITDIAATLVSLKFSRGNETDADDYSVIYLCPTEWKADGAAAFFEKLLEAGTASPPEFLSTHPNPGNRVQNIKDKKTALGCTGTGTFDQRYQNFKNTLP